jgi:hypothetical protein
LFGDFSFYRYPSEAKDTSEEKARNEALTKLSEKVLRTGAYLMVGKG